LYRENIFTNAPPSAVKPNKMRKSILLFTIIAVASTLVYTSCKSSSEKVESAEAKVTEAEQDLIDAQQEYRVDVDNYRMQTASTIEANNRNIAEFNARIEKEKSQVKAEYRQKIADLEAKNNEMKKKLDGYQAEGKDQWESFKNEFNRDMDQLGKSISDLTSKNK